MSSTINDTAKGSWNNFIALCRLVGGVSSRTSKTQHIHQFYQSFNGNLKVFLKLILPKVTQRRYQMNRKRMLKLFASIFSEDISVLNDLMTSGDKAGYLCEVISYCYKESVNNFPQRKKNTVLSMKDVDDFLDCLTKETRESQQEKLLKGIVLRCNVTDLKWIIREIDRDLKINAGTKAVLDAIDDKAYAVFQVKANLDYLVNKLSLGQNLTISADLMTPLKPMLASACKDYAMAFKKCKSGLIYAEIKYDGERVQIHYDGKEWKFYSRSLKPVSEYKIKHVQDAVTESCPNAKTLILDSEILMIDTKTQKPLPFTSLGKHKRDTFKDSSPCLFVFDILYFNGKSVINLPLTERRALLEKEFKEVQNKMKLSELTIIKTEDDLQNLMQRMLDEKQEGLVLKDSVGVYAPHKRHWLKMKKDYLEDGGLADSADLIVLGAYKGSGRHGGLYSTYLMGTLDKQTSVFQTVCKAHNGLSDQQIEDYTQTLNMDDFDADNCPSWLNVKKQLQPDWIVRNPKKSPIFEISGFEFSESKMHTATDYGGVPFSIRFPRITKIREDKKWKDATSLQELRENVKVARESCVQLRKGKKRKQSDDGNENDVVPKKKRKIEVEDEDEEEEEEVDYDDDDDGDINMGNNDNNHNKKKMQNLKVNINMHNNVTPPLVNMPASPKLLSDGRDECQYDDTCYRKNVEHLKKFKHPKKELSDSNLVREKAKNEMEEIVKRKEKMEKAAEINREKQLKKIKDEYDEKEKEIEMKYNKIMEKAKNEYDDKVIPIKQMEQFELEKIEKKYHPQ